MEVKTNPDDYSDLGSELQELILRMESFQDFIDNPTLEQLEKLGGDTGSPPILRTPQKEWII
jgi:hypothetical protein